MRNKEHYKIKQTMQKQRF